MNAAPAGGTIALNMRSLVLALLLGAASAQAVTRHAGPITLTTFERAADYGAAKLSGLSLTPSGSVTLAPGARSGTLDSLAIPVTPFDELIPSWNADTPPGSSLTLEVSARLGGRWTRFYSYGTWMSELGTSGETPKRASKDGQVDADGQMLTDTLRLKGKGDAYRLRLTLRAGSGGAAPSLRLLAFTSSDRAARAAGAGRPGDPSVWGRVLKVPQRSQMLYPDGGEVWCSPTSTSMIMAFWGKNVTVPEAARGTYDAVYDGTGNWPFNAAYAGHFGLRAYATRLGSLADAERFIARGVPLAVSAGWKKGELRNASVSSTDGHLMVLVGFDKNGNPVLNDPAGATDAQVRRTYDRASFERLWLGHSGGLVYVIAPPGQALPE